MNQRFAFSVICNGDNAIVGMDLGEVWRMRTLSRDLLLTLSRVCYEANTKVFGTVTRQDVEDVEHGRYIILAESHCGPCDVQIGVSRRDNGNPEFFIAIYDEGDESAPALLLIDEQITEFMKRVEIVTAH